MRALLLALVSVLLAAPTCAQLVNDNVVTPRELGHCSGDTNDKGVFDPSAAYDPITGKLWATMTSAEETTGLDATAAVHNLDTALCYSTDNGQTWTFQGFVFTSAYQAGYGGEDVVWQYEVSSLVRVSSSDWRVYVDRYPTYDDGTGRGVHPPFSIVNRWIQLATASTPEGLVSGPTYSKPLAGQGYDPTYADAILGAPTQTIDVVHASLDDCGVLTEPGATMEGSDLYLALPCPTGLDTTYRTFLLKQTGATGTFSLVGTLLNYTDALQITGGVYARIGAPDLFHIGSQGYMLGTPVRSQPSTEYRGQVAIPLTITTATVQRCSGNVLVVGKTPTRIPKPAVGLSQGHSGAGTFDVGCFGCGIWYFDRMSGSEYPPNARTYFSGNLVGPAVCP